tara:strand:+ start:206 stop:370 length:165 start_codon:yes stop_codon:yes gene_type:complete
MPYDVKFHQAAGEGHKKIVKQLIDKGAAAKIYVQVHERSQRVDPHIQCLMVVAF